MCKLKRVAAIHDLSGFGKCSLTVALPILSAAGLEACAMPTAVLSTHTGGIEGYTYRDLTEDLLPFGEHWRSLNLHFDAIYTGFLGSYAQIDLVSTLIDRLKAPDTLVVVDPCMADNGALYRVYTPEMAKGMRRLCAKADVLVPNLTEAAMLLDVPYRPECSREEVEELLKGLCALGCRQAVLTGVSFRPEELGAACYDRESQTLGLAFDQRIAGHYHGTGDVFASALTAALVKGMDLQRAARLAVRFTQGAIQRTKRAGTDERFGVNFEEELPWFMRELGCVCG